MKRTLAALFVGLSVSAASFAQTPTPASPPAAQASTVPVIDPAHQATEQQVRELFVVLHIDQVMKDLIERSFKAMQLAAPPYLPAAFWDDMQKTFRDYDLLNELVPEYQHYISREDLASVLAFYRTDAGKHMLEAQPLMTAETQAKFHDIGEKLGREVAARHKDEIVAAKKKYDDEIVAGRQNSSKKP
jgi:hypothetical protein